MDRFRNLFQPRQSYEPLNDGTEYTEVRDEEPEGEQLKTRFSWAEYGVFFIMGIAMLWAWNMFLAAGPYFQTRFRSSESILKIFQSAELSIANITNLFSMIVLTKLQAKASYPKRIITALLINIVIFALLSLSTFFTFSAGVYFAFLLLIVLSASLAAALLQNGTFALVGGYGHESYTQGIMTGQAVAGVLPCIAQIVSVLSVPENKGAEENIPQESSTSAFASFLTAVAVSVVALVALLYLLARHPRPQATLSVSSPDGTDAAAPARRTVSLLTLFKKLFWLATAVALVFAVTMVFPVFTQKIESIRDSSSAPRWLQPAAFIPLAFLFWNSGDLIGRLFTSIPALRFTSRPKVLFFMALARVVFVPLYLLCNIGGRGAKVQSDFFYLVVVQLLFGITNGFIGSQCMMGATEWVDPEEREAAGGFMVLCLVAGLTVGSFISFAVGARL